MNDYFYEEEDDDLTSGTCSTTTSAPTTPVWKPPDFSSLETYSTPDSICMTGWRRDSTTNLWGPTEPLKVDDITDALYKKGGYCFPIYYNGTSYYLPVSIGESALSLVISTTRRTLSISSKDTLLYNMTAEEEDLVCCFPNKQCQLYCAPVVFVSDTKEDIINIPKFDFYVSEGNFKSRIGLLGGTDQRCIFTHLRLRTDLFCIHLRGFHESTLMFGERSTAPPNTKRIQLVHWIVGNKEMIALPTTRIQCGKMKYRFEQGIPSIVHLETPRICIPQDLFEQFVEEINRKTGLFTCSIVEEKKDIEAVKNKFPSLKLWVQCDDGTETRLSIRADQYLIPSQPDSTQMSIAVAPVEKNSKLGPCIIFGNIVLKGRRLTVSMSQQNAWLW